MLGLGLHINKSNVLETGVPIPLQPVAWYNEKSLSSYNNGQSVDIYLDKSEGTSFNLLQTDVNKRPVVDIQEGKKVLFFTNDILVESELPVLDGSSEFTMIYVGKLLSTYHTGIYIGDNLTPDNTSSFRLGRSTSNKLRAILGDGAGGLFETPFSFQNNGTVDIAYAYGTSSSSADIYVGLDDGNVNQEIQFPNHSLDLVFGRGIGIGTNNPEDPSQTGTGTGWWMYEVIVYDRALTSTELTSVREYLRNKWNV